MGKKNRSQHNRASDASAGAILFIIGLALLVSSMFAHGPAAIASGMGLGGLICVGIGFATLLNSRRLPIQAIMRLAEERQGLLTLSEISTALNLDPHVVKRALSQLSKAGVATQRWQELRKNVWEFPDYLKLPIPESIELAKSKGGRLTLDDLTAAGHTPETARQTLDTLSQKGLAQPDPSSPPSATAPALIVTTQ